MATEADYMMAVDEPSYRQAFLDSIDMEGAQPYVRKVIYRTSADDDTLMKISPSFLQRCNVRRIRSQILVYPRAFLRRFTPLYDDFLGVLIDHEGCHARQLYENPGDVLFSYWRILFDDSGYEEIIQKSKRLPLERELTASVNEWIAVTGKKRNFSDLYKSHVCDEVAELCASLGSRIDFTTGDGQVRTIEPRFNQELRRRW